jgi:RNA-binding protein
LQEIGEVLHLANSGRVIVQLDRPTKEGQILCNQKGVRIAKVMEMIGPVAKPYASASPLTNSIKKFIGKKVFALDYPPAQKKNRRTRRK